MVGFGEGGIRMEREEIGGDGVHRKVGDGVERTSRVDGWTDELDCKLIEKRDGRTQSVG